MWSALVFLAGMIFLRMASKDMNKKEVVKCRQKKNCARCDVAHRGRRNNLPNHKPGRVCHPSGMDYRTNRKPVCRNSNRRTAVHHPVRSVLSV